MQLRPRCKHLLERKPNGKRSIAIGMVQRIITEEERYRLRALQNIRPAWWCGDSRFIQQFKVTHIDTPITERQAWFIKVLWYKYRAQLGHDGPKPEGYE